MSSDKKDLLYKIIDRLEKTVEEDESVIIPEELITGESWLSNARQNNEEKSLRKAVETYSLLLGNWDLDIIKAGWQLGVKRYAKEPRIAGVVGYEEWEP
jgi:hypothetical protein